MINQAMNYLKALPTRIVYSKLNVVEAIVLALVLMVTSTVIIYMVNPRVFAY